MGDLSCVTRLTRCRSIATQIADKKEKPQSFLGRFDVQRAAATQLAELVDIQLINVDTHGRLVADDLAGQQAIAAFDEQPRFNLDRLFAVVEFHYNLMQCVIL